MIFSIVRDRNIRAPHAPGEGEGASWIENVTHLKKERKRTAVIRGF